MKLFVVTQYRENYGAHNWDGKGECPQYWKNKGGITYFVQLGSTITPEQADDAARKVAETVVRYNDYVEEYVIDWFVEADDYLTPFEKDQLEYEGVIKYGPQEVTI